MKTIMTWAGMVPTTHFAVFESLQVVSSLVCLPVAVQHRARVLADGVSCPAATALVEEGLHVVAVIPGARVCL